MICGACQRVNLAPLFSCLYGELKYIQSRHEGRKSRHEGRIVQLKLKSEISLSTIFEMWYYYTEHIRV